MLGRKHVMEAMPVSVKFGGQVEQVDLNTFTRVLLDYGIVLRAACAEEDRGLRITTNIRQVRPGCLVVDLGVVADGIGGLFKDPSTALQTVEAAVTIATSFYAFKKYLGKHGRVAAANATEDGTTTVETEDGTRTSVATQVVNIYVNAPEAGAAVNASFASLDEDGRIESLTIGAGDGCEEDQGSFVATRDEFHEIASSPSYEGPDVRHEVDAGKLVVVKPYLGASTTRKWEFLYRGMKITANITDAEFMDGIERQSFRVGMVMDVEMDITKQYDRDLRAFVNKSYTVTKVTSISSPPEEVALF